MGAEEATGGGGGESVLELLLLERPPTIEEACNREGIESRGIAARGSDEDEVNLEEKVNPEE